MVAPFECLDAWTAQSMATKVDEQAVSMVKQGPEPQHGSVVKTEDEARNLATTITIDIVL